MDRKLYVKRTSVEELANQWGFVPVLKGNLFIRSNKNGRINWDKAPIYFSKDLIVKNNVVILN